MNNNTNNAQAVVMGLTETGLSIARSLGRRGIGVTGVSPLSSISSERHPASYSRFLTYVQEPQTESENERLNFFINFGQKFESRPVILPTFDPNVVFLSQNRYVLEKYFRFILPSHQLLKSITSKSGLIDVAERHKIPLPSSIRVNNTADLKKIPSNFFPCVLKPESQNAWLTEEALKFGIFGLKAIPAMNQSELCKQYDRVKEIDSRLIVQTMVVGPDENHIDYHALIDSDGRIIAEFVGKKLRLTPPNFGMGCYVESVKSDKVVNEGRRILRLLNYKGMANINFKQDERDGRLYFLELNPRFSFWTGLDVACGVDFPYYYYQACLGEQIIAQRKYLLGKRWLSLLDDIKGLRTKLKDGSLTLHQWVLSVIKTDIGAIYTLDDPLPAIMLLFYAIKWRIRIIIIRIKSFKWLSF
jgi:D-aspartate ligase